MADYFLNAYWLDWANLLLRWAHIIVGIAWIGSSFYFVWLDNHLQKPTTPDLLDKGVSGELWAVHGGGFYNPQKYMVAPKSLPHDLHWFYWESYSTWMTGFALFVALYLFNPSVYLIDKSVMDLGNGAAIGLALSYLVAGWIVYDLICRLFGHNKDGSIGNDFKVGVLISLYIVAATWLACHLFAGRAAFLLTGAMLATIMSANVFFWIIPGQETVIAEMRSGQAVNPIHGQRGKQRSVHNTYFTLPVLFAMLSNHYSMTYSFAHNWAVLVLIMLAGVLIRQFFILRHKGNSQWRYPAAGVAILFAVAVWIKPAEVEQPAIPSQSTVQGIAPSTQASPVDMTAVQSIINARCVMCHNAVVANKGVRLDSPESITKHAQQIYQQAVVQKAMPMNNSTQITDAERATLGAWFKQLN